jgi:Relaxase/Mobilisation nuclease domain
MYFKMTFVADLVRSLRYHQQKVERGVAKYLYAGNMMKDVGDLNYEQKQWFIRRLLGLNDAVQKKVLHYMASFDRDDLVDDHKMRKICLELLEEDGLGQQPNLIIRHLDTPHSHVHILTTHIRSSGEKINLWPRKKERYKQFQRLEQKYQLRPFSQQMSHAEWVEQYPAQKVVYGVTPLKPTMNAVLEMIIPTYQYTTLEELNAVLRPYQIKAGRGREDSVTYQNNGLLYWPLKPSGELEHTYIKSSALWSKPTMKRLQQQFVINQELREKHRQRLTTAIDLAFYQNTPDLPAFKQALQRDKIYVMEDRGADRALRNIYYIDQVTKSVWDGVSLGPTYAAAGISARCVPEEEYRQVQQQKLKQTQALRHEHF